MFKKNAFFKFDNDIKSSSVFGIRNILKLSFYSIFHKIYIDNKK